MKRPWKTTSCRMALLLFAAGVPLATSAQTGGACPAIVTAARPTIAPPQRFRAGDVLPNFALDSPLRWLECPAPEFPAGAGPGASRRVFLVITVDENGGVADVKPRGAIDAEGYFDAAVAAVRRWKSTAPKWKSLAARSAFAADIIFDRSQPSGAPAAVAAPTPTPTPTPTQTAPASAAEKTVEPPQVTAPPAASSVEKPSPPPISEAGAKPEQKATTPDPTPSAASSAGAPPATADPKPAAATPVESRASTPSSSNPTFLEVTSEPADSCPQFFMLPAGPNPRTYSAGEMVPNSSLDAKPVWVRCPWPDFGGIAPRTAMVIAVIDENGAVREVRPRGHRENEPIFLRAKAALSGWRVAPAPRHKGQPVLTTTAIDIPTSGPPRRATSTAAPVPSQPSTAMSPAPQRDDRAQQAGAEAPFAVEYYYKVKWGFADEFWKLFLKNHWPVLRRQMESGRILEVRASKPVYHATEDGRWDYRVTIVFRSAAAAYAVVDTAALERQLFPDQETFRREEQRRFELLLAHWDVPVAAVPLNR